MKKIFAALLALTLLCGTSALAAAEEKTTVVTAVVGEAYTLTLPPTLNLVYGTESTDLTVTVSALRLASGHVLRVTPKTASGSLSSAAGGSLVYTLTNGAAAFSAANPLEFTTETSAAIKLNITKSAWNAAAAGTYTDTLTFTVGIAAK